MRITITAVSHVWPARSRTKQSSFSSWLLLRTTCMHSNTHPQSPNRNNAFLNVKSKRIGNLSVTVCVGRSVLLLSSSLFLATQSIFLISDTGEGYLFCLMKMTLRGYAWLITWKTMVVENSFVKVLPVLWFSRNILLNLRYGASGPVWLVGKRNWAVRCFPT